MRLSFLLALLVAPILCAGEPFVPLFDGKTLDGWKAVTETNWRVEQGAIVADEGEVGLLVHKDHYQNYELRLEVKAAKGTNSGIFLSTPEKPKKVAADCYELNIAPPDNPFPTGSLVGRIKFAEAGETDTWRKFEVRVENGRVTVKLDGKRIVDHAAKPAATGKFIGLQKNAGWVAFRKIEVRKLP